LIETQIERISKAIRAGKPTGDLLVFHLFSHHSHAEPQRLSKKWDQYHDFKNIFSKKIEEQSWRFLQNVQPFMGKNITTLIFK
jgi:hypothetical protein